MSYSPAPSTKGQASSSPPEANLNTPSTVYSPEFVRAAGKSQAPLSAVAAGKQPVREPAVDPIQAPLQRTQAKFANEFEPGHPEFISRHLSVVYLPDGSPVGYDAEGEMQFVQSRMKEYAAFMQSVPLFARGVHIRFDSLRDACEAKYVLDCLGCKADHITGYDYAIAKSQDTAAFDDYEGQVRVEFVVQPMQNLSRKGLSELEGYVQQIAGMFGDVREMEHCQTDRARGVVTYRMEFQSVDAANRMAAGLKDCSPYGRSDDQWSWTVVSCARWMGPRREDSPNGKTPRKDDQGRLVGFLHQQPRVALEPYMRHPADQHNRVHRERINEGRDVRTTVMLRNIPNKLDWMSLKEILDEACYGSYDFLYLRIDFKSGCNVGYAFINFTDMQGMLKLVSKIEHKTWPGYRSAKAAEVSYATIQGKEALIQKFRNSSVMQETPFCRPRLFVSKQDAIAAGNIRLIGTEVEFPRPDNQAKLQRSMDSARTVGLYPPHGVGSSNDHRNRSSAYDRGTPRDIVQSMSALSIAPRNGPTGFQQLSPAVKHNIELWYNQMYGSDHCCPVPFEFIPNHSINQFFALNSSGVSMGFERQTPGVIGRPDNFHYSGF